MIGFVKECVLYLKVWVIWYYMPRWAYKILALIWNKFCILIVISSKFHFYTILLKENFPKFIIVWWLSLLLEGIQYLALRSRGHLFTLSWRLDTSILRQIHWSVLRFVHWHCLKQSLLWSLVCETTKLLIFDIRCIVLRLAIIILDVSKFDLILCLNFLVLLCKVLLCWWLIIA